MNPDPIVEAFERRLRDWPETPIALCSQSVLSAADLGVLAAGVEARLADAGLGAGDLVGLTAPSGPGFLAALLGLRRAGCAALLLGAGSPAAERAGVARDLGARALLEAPAWPESAEALRLEPIDPAARGPLRLDPETAVVKLTSGSTGRPRGILVSGEALLADDAALAASMDLADDERILAAIPMAHSYGLASVALPALARPSLLVLPAGGNPFAALVAARRHRATFFPTVPAYLQALLAQREPPPWPRTVRRTITAGAPLPPAVARRFRQVTGKPVHVFYGSSESGGITYDRRGDAGERGSLGTPVEGVTIELEPVDEARSLVVVRSPAVARGYLGEEGPVDDPALAGGRFRTSDLGELRDGELYLLGRVDEVINIKGKKVHPREVEDVLRAASGVDDVAVLAAPRPGGGEILRAVVATRAALEREALLAWCRERLAEHKVPRSLVLVDELPRTERGKLDRRALAGLPAPGAEA